MTWLEDLAELRRLLDEMHEDWKVNGDGCCKSSEGAISVNFPNWFEAEDYRDCGPSSCEVYSYLFGPHRNHYFGSVREALDDVRNWHAAWFEYGFRRGLDNWGMGDNEDWGTDDS